MNWKDFGKEVVKSILRAYMYAFIFVLLEWIWGFNGTVVFLFILSFEILFVFISDYCDTIKVYNKHLDTIYFAFRTVENDIKTLAEAIKVLYSDKERLENEVSELNRRVYSIKRKVRVIE